MKRAISTAYYALFHALCRNCADCFIGGQNASRSKKAWLQAYRAADNKFSSTKCKTRSVMSKFPKEIEDFANMFVSSQAKRTSADYDPTSKFTRSEVLTEIDSVEVAIKGFNSTPLKDRRAFAAWVMIKDR